MLGSVKLCRVEKSEGREVWQGEHRIASENTWALV